LVFFKGNDEKGKEQNGQSVFEQPVVHVVGSDKSSYPNNGKYTQENPKPRVFVKRCSFFGNGDGKRHNEWV
jgi:hypothetical protein